MNDVDACLELFAQIGRDHARKIMGRVVLQDCDPDALAIEIDYALANAANFLFEHGTNREDAAIAVAEIHRAMVAEGRRIADALYTGGTTHAGH